MRQTKTRSTKNTAVILTIKQHAKAIRKAIDAGDYAKAEEAMKLAIKAIDKAQQNKVLKKNTAARKKSRLSKALKVARAKK